MRLKHTKVNASVDTGMNYWYLFKHGLGPGTMPKGVNVLKAMDDGWKDYVLLDRMLTTDELNEYEIKEATPPEDLLAKNGYSSLEETYREFNGSTSIKGNSTFDSWYDSLPSSKQAEVDDYCDEEGYPLYDECSDSDLSAIMDYFQSQVKGSDDMWSDTSSRYYVTPDISEFDIDFAAESVAKYLKRRELDQITTEDVIEQLRSLSDMWDEYWAYGLRTKEDEQAFLDNFLVRLSDYGIDNVVDNTFASIECADEVRMTDGSASNYQSFMAWYNSLSSYQKMGVDDYAEEHDYPAYEECTFGMLANMKREFGEEEEEDEWAMPKGVYHVAAFGNDYDELQTSFDFKDPKSAITKWVELQKSYPINVMITGFQEEEENLRKYVTEHPDWYRQLSAKFNCPYDAEYIINECAKPVRPWTGKYANKYPDQCHPFGLG